MTDVKKTILSREAGVSGVTVRGLSTWDDTSQRCRGSTSRLSISHPKEGAGDKRLKGFDVAHEFATMIMMMMMIMSEGCLHGSEHYSRLQIKMVQERKKVTVVPNVGTRAWWWWWWLLGRERERA